MTPPPLAVGVVAFTCVFGGVLLGMWLQKCLPAHHLGSDSKDVVKLGMGLVGTMAALALGLLLASAKSAYDAQAEELRHMAATALLLDRALAHYGPEAKEARELLRTAVAHAIAIIWSSEDRTLAVPAKPHGRDVFDAIEQLTPETAGQRLLQTQIVRIGIDLGRLRLLLFEEGARTMPIPFVVMLVFWLTIIFVSFGLFGPPNATVVITMFVSALSVSGALYLILELAHPFAGLLQLSDAPLRGALQNLGR